MQNVLKTASLFLLIALPVGCTFLAGQSSAQVLLRQSDLVYQGAFRLPQGDFGSPQYSGFNYGGTALGYNPARNSLYIVGHDWYQLSAEVSIPQIINSTNLNSLATATVLQPFSDSLEGKIASINPTDTNAKKIGGHLVYGGALYVAAYSYYDGGATQSSSHFVRPTNLSTTGQVNGPYRVGTIGPRYVAGYMAPVPQDWQSAFGSPALTGQCCLSIISTTSQGPAVFGFNPADLGSKNPIPATPLVEYPPEHPTLGAWGGNGTPNPVYNMSTAVRGLVFPQGTRSVLFFGSTGLGVPCYGAGTSDPSLDRQPVPGESGVIYCYDPDNRSKGCHAYPYGAFVWAYDANDLLAVKNGQKNPWEVTPYATWSPNFPTGGYQVNGAAYDPSTGRIYVAVMWEDGSMPLIHVLKVNVPGGGDTTPPSAPRNLRTR
jgi:hypothetical protein